MCYVCWHYAGDEAGSDEAHEAATGPNPAEFFYNTVDPNLAGFPELSPSSVGSTITTINNAGGGFDYLLPIVEDLTSAALDGWLQYFTGAPEAVIDVVVNLDRLGPSTVASAGPGLFGYFNDEGGVTFDPVSVLELNTGTDFNGADADISITINLDFITGPSAFLSTDPDAVIPSGQLDFLSVLQHEIGHGLGFTGYREADDVQLPEFNFGQGLMPYGTTYDYLVEFTGGRPFFVGENAVSVYGAPIPLEYLRGPGSDIAHFAGSSSDPRPRDTALAIMNPFVIPGDRTEIGVLELAVMADLGYLVTIPSDLPLVNEFDGVNPASIPVVEILDGLTYNADTGRFSVTLISSGPLFNNVYISVGYEFTGADDASRMDRAFFRPSNVGAGFDGDVVVAINAATFLGADPNLNPDQIASSVDLRLFFPAQGVLSNGEQEQTYTLTHGFITGTDNSDDLSAVAGGSIIFAGSGDDILTGSADSDQFFGGAGTDVAQIGVAAAGSEITAADFDFSGLSVDAFGVVSGTINGQYGIDSLDGIEVLEIVNPDASLFVVLAGMSQAAAEAAAGDGDTIQLSDGSTITVGNAVPLNPITGTNAAETLNGTSDGDLITGLGGNDILNGLGGNDTFFFEGTNAGLDQIDGGAGIDTWSGGSGDDRFYVGASLNNLTSIEVIDGGEGWDMISGGKPNDVFDFGALGISLIGIENILGGRGRDTLVTLDIGAEATPSYSGGLGNDTFIFGSANAVITDFSPGADKADFTRFAVSFDALDSDDSGALDDGDDFVGVSGGNLIIQPVAGLPQITFEGITSLAFADVIFNDDVPDTPIEPPVDTVAPIITINALTTTDTTPALSGAVDDPLAAITVSVDGQTHTATNNGNGTWSLADDTLSPLALGTYDVSVSAVDGAGNTGADSSSDELIIEAAGPANLIEGTDNAETLTGTEGDDIIRGLGGNDELLGLGGDDRFEFEGDGAGLDRIDGGAGIDTWAGGSSDDTFYVGRNLANLHNLEIIDGGAGFDVIEAGKQSETLDFGVSGPALVGIEQVNGGRGRDTIIMSDTPGIAYSGGRAGDTFVFTDADATVLDFQQSEDFADFSAFGITFAGLDTSGNGLLDDADDFVSASGDDLTVSPDSGTTEFVFMDVGTSLAESAFYF